MAAFFRIFFVFSSCSVRGLFLKNIISCTQRIKEGTAKQKYLFAVPFCLEVDAIYTPYNNPYGQNPYLYQQPQQYMQQIGMNQPQQPQEMRITVAQVPTVDQVERVQMLPNERKIVLVQNDPNLLAIRVADAAGWVSTEYRTSSIIDPKTMQQQVQYAPIQSVMELKSDVEKIKEILGGAMNAKPASSNASGAE